MAWIFIVGGVLFFVLGNKQNKGEDKMEEKEPMPRPTKPEGWGKAKKEVRQETKNVNNVDAFDILDEKKKRSISTEIEDIERDITEQMTHLEKKHKDMLNLRTEILMSVKEKKILFDKLQNEIDRVEEILKTKKLALKDDR